MFKKFCYLMLFLPFYISSMHDDNGSLIINDPSYQFEEVLLSQCLRIAVEIEEAVTITHACAILNNSLFIYRQGELKIEKALPDLVPPQCTLSRFFLKRVFNNLKKIINPSFFAKIKSESVTKTPYLEKILITIQQHYDHYYIQQADAGEFIPVIPVIRDMIKFVES